MELIMWIGVGMVVGLGCLVLIPVMVVGTCYVVLTTMLGISDGILWIVGRNWRTFPSWKVPRTVAPVLLPKTS